MGNRLTRLSGRLMALDIRADRWIGRHQSWRFAVKMMVVEVVLFAVLFVGIASLISGKLVLWGLLFGPLLVLGNAPFFVLFVPLRRTRLSRIDDRLFGPAGPRPRRPLPYLTGAGLMIVRNRQRDAVGPPSEDPGGGTADS